MGVQLRETITAVEGGFYGTGMFTAAGHDEVLTTLSWLVSHGKQLDAALRAYKAQVRTSLYEISKKHPEVEDTEVREIIWDEIAHHLPFMRPLAVHARRGHNE